MKEETKKKLQNWLPYIVAFSSTIFMLGSGTAILIHDHEEMPKLEQRILEQMNTNQTYVDSLNCKQLELGIAAGEMFLWDNQQR